MRGEDVEEQGEGPDSEGSPPHARGRLDVLSEAAVDTGITPACAGKTLKSRRI